MTKTSHDKMADRSDAGGSLKREQIMAGAREVFRANGYDGASMDQIARTSGVSKGTLYVYFSDKEALFKALILEERSHQPDASIVIDCEDLPVRQLLETIGRLFLRKFLRPERLSTLRMVIGATEKFPEFGALLFEAGPAAGRRRLAEVIRRRCATGELVCDDPELAGSQFADLCGAWLIRKTLFLPGEIVSEAEIDKNVAGAVRVFMAAYAAEESKR